MFVLQQCHIQSVARKYFSGIPDGNLNEAISSLLLVGMETMFEKFFALFLFFRFPFVFIVKRRVTGQGVEDALRYSFFKCIKCSRLRLVKSKMQLKDLSKWITF